MQLKQNINKVHGDITNYFENVKISEKSNKEFGNYFELSILENTKEVKAIIKMTDIENANFSWQYYANPEDEKSLVERNSSIYTFSSDIQDIFEKNRFSPEYANKIEIDTESKFTITKVDGEIIENVKFFENGEWYVDNEKGNRLLGGKVPIGAIVKKHS